MRRIVLSLLAGALILGVVAAPVSARRAGPTIVETAVAANASGPLAGQFDTLISLVTTYGLADTLNGNRQFTVFAPTDAAFDKLFAVVDPSTLTAKQIVGILKYHVAPGRKLSGAVLAADSIKTLNGGSLTPSVQGGAAYVNDAKIIAADIRTSNGIIHVIDAVLLP
jgi:uncharacterized surface protein with fasciclin (FAS1) repeats